MSSFAEAAAPWDREVSPGFRAMWVASIECFELESGEDL